MTLQSSNKELTLSNLPSKYYREVLSVFETTLGPVGIGHSVFSLLEGNHITMTEGLPFDEVTVKYTIPYVVSRIPKELFAAVTDQGFSIKPTHLVLTNNHDMFAAEGIQDSLQTAPSRRRWYLVHEEEDKRTIYLHIRDGKEGETDMIEIMTMLFVFHTLRKANPASVNLYLMGLKSFPPEGVNRLFLNQDLFSQWQKNPFDVTLDFDSQRGSAVDKLVTDLKDCLPTSNEKPFLLIGNDFSMKLILFTLVLDKENENKLRKIFENELMQISVYLDSLGITKHESTKELKSFVEKYVLLALLNKTYRHKESLQGIYEAIFSQTNYEMLGFQRLLDGVRKSNQRKKSILAEPVDYWDPKKFNSSLLDDEALPIKRIFQYIVETGKPIVSIPYLIGTISAELVSKLIKEGLVDESSIGFIGKVGNIVLPGTNFVPRGTTVVPEYVFFQGRDGLEYPTTGFYYPSEIIHLIHTALGGSIVTVPAVLSQTFSDFTNPDGKPVDSNIFVDMEQWYIIAEALEELKKLGFNTRIISSFYVSDNSVSPQAKNQGFNGVTLATPMSFAEGTVAACLTTLFELTQFAYNFSQSK